MSGKYSHSDIWDLSLFITSHEYMNHDLFCHFSVGLDIEVSVFFTSLQIVLQLTSLHKAFHENEQVEQAFIEDKFPEAK